MTTNRQTLQRDIVFQMIIRMEGHGTADMIYEQVHQAYPSISRATVYRNLKVLETQKKIIKIQVANGADFYEPATAAHYHIKCSRCQKIFDASLPYMPDLLKLEQASDKDFDITAYSLLFEGLCPECKKKGGTHLC